ncbi:MAG: acyltransferase [Pedobacter sp.]|nr:MAG: acyltransferase [Pedobacter sp.]
MRKIKGIIFYIYNFLLSKIIKVFKIIEVEDGVKFQGWPHIIKHNYARIIIGSGTTINSSNYGYHVNMFSKCKLYASKNNALIKVGKNTRIHGTCIHAFNKIVIGDKCLIAANTQIIDSNGHELCFENPAARISSPDKGREIEIGNNVWIATNCIILGGTSIGDGSIITAGSVVKGEVPARCIYGGNPGKVIKMF